MFRLYCWICATWQSYAALALWFLSFLPNKFMWRHSAKRSGMLLWICTRAFSYHLHNRELMNSGCIEGSELRSKTEKLCFNVHKLLRLSSRLKTFTRSDTWQHETGKGLCVIAVKGTDQISRSTLNSHRSAEIKDTMLCRNLFFPMLRCHAWPRNHMWASTLTTAAR